MKSIGPTWLKRLVEPERSKYFERVQILNFLASAPSDEEFKAFKHAMLIVH